MSESDSLNRLRDHRAALLTCEAIGWLHMAGKAHPDFLRQNASGGPLNGQQWDVKTWAKNLYSKFGTLPHFKTLPQTDAQTISPRDLFEKYEGSGQKVAMEANLLGLAEKRVMEVVMKHGTTDEGERLVVELHHTQRLNES